MAEQHKAAGNALFTAGKYDEAAKCYEKAVALAPEDPVYLSNLSAAQFELGRYDACAATILKIAPLIPKASEALTRKLSHRLARALSHAKMGGSSSRTYDKQAIAAFERIAGTSDKDLQATWAMWRTVEAKDMKTWRRESEAALASQRMFKNMQASYGFEYYTVGQDDVESLLFTHPVLPNIDISQLSNAELGDLAFLWGGCGDCRHPLGTLIDVHQQSLSLKSAKRSAIRLHMTLVDLHPTTIGRVLLNLFLLNDLAEAMGTDDEEEAVATFFYWFLSPLVPAYVYSRMVKTIQSIIQQLKTDSLPSWITGPTRPSIPAVIKALNYWLDKRVNSVNTRDFMRNVQVHEPRTVEQLLDSMEVAGMQMTPEYVARLRASRAWEAQAIIDTHMEYPMGQLRSLVKDEATMSDAQVREYVKKAVKKSSARFIERSGIYVMQEEESVYPKLKTILPSEKLMTKYHTAMIPIGREVLEMWVDPYSMEDPPKGLPTKSAMNEALEHLRSEWKPNLMPFDRNMELAGYPTGFPDCAWDPFKTIGGFEEILGQRIRDGSAPDLRKVGRLAFERGALFFRRAARAFKAMRDHVTFEVVSSDIYTWFEKCRLGLARPKKSKFPKQFTRMWLSNVPDYGQGTLNISVLAAPCLQRVNYSGVLYNILLNTGTWENVDHYSYHYSYMRRNEMPGLLGCKLHWMPDGASSNQAITPVLTDSLVCASRADITNWLMRVLVHHAYQAESGRYRQGARIDTPNTLVFFLRVLIYLHTINVPSHFLAEILQTVLLDKVVSDVQPYKGRLPITPHGRHSGKPRKLHLAPWLVELETVVAQTRGALPFAIQLPEDFPGPADIITCEVDAPIHDDYMLGAASRQPALAAMLIAPDLDIRQMPDIYFDMLEGRHAQSALFFTGVVIHDRKTASWSMPANKAYALQRAKWRMAVVRMDDLSRASPVVPGSAWKLPLEPIGVASLD